MDEDRASLQVINSAKVNFGVKQDIAKIDWNRLFAGEGQSGKLNVFYLKSYCVFRACLAANKGC